jgi:hypothetical protein
MFHQEMYLAVGEHTRGYDFVWTKGLPRIDEGSQNLASFLAFTYRVSAFDLPSLIEYRGHTPHGRGQWVVKAHLIDAAVLTERRKENFLHRRISSQEMIE